MGGDGLQLGEQTVHLAELLAQFAGIVAVSGDAHQAAQVQAGQGGDGLGEREQCFGRDTVFGGFAGDVDFYQRLQVGQMRGALLAQSLGEFCAV